PTGVRSFETGEGPAHPAPRTAQRIQMEASATRRRLMLGISRTVNAITHTNNVPLSPAPGNVSSPTCIDAPTRLWTARMTMSEEPRPPDNAERGTWQDTLGDSVEQEILIIPLNPLIEVTV